MSPFTSTRSNNKNNGSNIFTQTREYIHTKVQTDQERETLEEGWKSAVDRVVEQVSLKPAYDGLAVAALKIDEYTNPNFKTA